MVKWGLIKKLIMQMDFSQMNIDTEGLIPNSPIKLLVQN